MKTKIVALASVALLAMSSSVAFAKSYYGLSSQLQLQDSSVMECQNLYFEFDEQEVYCEANSIWTRSSTRETTLDTAEPVALSAVQSYTITFFDQRVVFDASDARRVQDYIHGVIKKVDEHDKKYSSCLSSSMQSCIQGCLKSVEAEPIDTYDSRFRNCQASELKAACKMFEKY